MLNRELILNTGEKLYPQFLTRDQRMYYANKYKNMNMFMRCGCRNDVSLWYRFSVDGKCYPEHMNYVHSKYCIFSTLNRRIHALTVDPENGETKIYLDFEPSVFTVPTDTKPERNSSESGQTAKEEGDRFFPLERLVRQLNIEAWNARMAAGENLLSASYFRNALYARLKSVVIDRLKKPLREYTLQQDSFQFFYQPFCGYEMKEKDGGSKSCSLKVNGEDNKVYNWFVYEKTLNVALKRFYRMYDRDPNDMMKDTDIIMAGFRYLKKKKGSDVEYKVAGRVCLFAVNKNGIIGRSNEEIKALNNICELLRWNKDTLKYYVADDGEPFFGYFEKKGEMDKYILTAESDTDGMYGNILQTDMTELAPSQTELKNFLKLYNKPQNNQ